jgi:hypothetical protein
MTRTWNSAELESIGTAAELRITALRADGSDVRPVPIWAVRVGDRLYVRSWRGPDGAWFRAARASHAAKITAAGIEYHVQVRDAGDGLSDAVDDAYRTKYSRFPSYVEPMVGSPARDTTLELVPRGNDS